MIVNPGEKLHVITRLRFEGDLRRHFVGEVLVATETLVRLRGYAFIFDPWANSYVRKPEVRERIVPLGDSGLILTLLPPDLDLDRLHYQMTPETRLMLSDGNGFSLDINEFSPRR